MLAKNEVEPNSYLIDICLASLSITSTRISPMSNVFPNVSPIFSPAIDIDFDVDIDVDFDFDIDFEVYTGTYRFGLLDSSDFLRPSLVFGTIPYAIWDRQSTRCDAMRHDAEAKFAFVFVRKSISQSVLSLPSFALFGSSRASHPIGYFCRSIDRWWHMSVAICIYIYRTPSS